MSELVAKVPPLHPDDGHRHQWGCRLCGVDPAAREGLDVEGILALIYRQSGAAALAVANVCDDRLDRSGALLGRVRNRALSTEPES